MTVPSRSRRDSGTKRQASAISPSASTKAISSPFSPSSGMLSPLSVQEPAQRADLRLDHPVPGAGMDEGLDLGAEGGEDRLGLAHPRERNVRVARMATEQHRHPARASAVVEVQLAPWR